PAAPSPSNGSAKASKVAIVPDGPSAGELKSLSTVYPSSYTLPPYEGPKFRWIKDACGQLLDGRVICWAFGDQPSYREVPEFRNVLKGSSLPTCLITAAGIVKCNGNNFEGTMGPNCPFQQ